MPQPRLGLAGKWLAFENVLLHQPLLNEARIPFVGKVICSPENKNYRYHSIIKKRLSWKMRSNVKEKIICYSAKGLNDCEFVRGDV